MLETDGGLRVLIDCGPDFRQQIMRYNRQGKTPFFDKIDAVLFTHIHYDHVGGTDDLRPFAWFGDVDIYAQKDVIDGLHQTMPYCFKEQLYPGVPHLKLHQISAGRPFTVRRPYESTVEVFEGGATLQGIMRDKREQRIIPPALDELEILPIRVMHGNLPILGFRIGKFAYITDMKYMEDEDAQMLQGLETLVINALRFKKEHHSHQLVNDAIEFAHKVGARKTYFIHLTHDIGTHDWANSQLPDGFEFAFDGQVIEC
jgi:phosphoribosyl 1,2-cyclic phosphate phosphodiesterase